MSRPGSLSVTIKREAATLKELTLQPEADLRPRTGKDFVQPLEVFRARTTISPPRSEGQI
jgi:hypothetical protein